MKKTKYKNKHKVISKKKGFIIALAFIGIILAVSVIWIVSVKLYPSDSKHDVDNSSDKVVEPIHEQENSGDVIEDGSNAGDTNPVLPSNNVETPQSVTQTEQSGQDGVQAEEPSQSRMEAPQSWDEEWSNTSEKSNE